ncbi:MAG: sugar transferase [Pseudomonadota bacterium]
MKQTTFILLAGLDILGLLVIFNTNHWLITGEFSSVLLVSWKLILIMGISFLVNYLLDLFDLDSSLSQLGLLERSFIAMLLTALAVMVMVYVIGPSFIGGFVGRGVLASSLMMLWLWSLFVRYLLNNWSRWHRSQVRWVLLTDSPNDELVEDIRTTFSHEILHTLSKVSVDSEAAVSGSWEDLGQLVAQEEIAGVIVTHPNDLPQTLIEQLMAIRISGTRVFTVNDFYETFMARLPVRHLNEQFIAMAHGFDLIHNPIGLRFKRYLDITIALIGAVVLAPVMIVLSALILITEGRPVLYRQLRTGENGTPFWVNKFRTMVNDAESDGARFAEKDDPRVTRFGNTMRKFRLDELPQFWNVLVGEMSFIGPRPERPEFIEALSEEIPYYNLRHIVKPGLTGWAQVMYGYGDSTDDAMTKLQYDLFYIKNYSLLLDVSILVRSVKVILFGTGR